MFGNFSDKIKSALDGIRKKSRITEENIKPVLQELHVALLEADTALPVVKSMIENLTTKAIGTEASRIQKSLNPSQVFISLVHKELTEILGGEQEILNMKTQPPAVIMIVGLQGAGKTSSLAKIALWLKKTRRKKVLLAGLDISRPAASEQLATLAQQATIDYYAGKQRDNLEELTKDLLEQAQLGGYDCLLVDTSGRIQNDNAVMQELKTIHGLLKPVETLYTMDSMGGQNAAHAAVGFKDTIKLTGMIATKLDAAARGGAVLSAKYLTHLPIKMISNGEKLTDIMDFNPSAMAENIMGMNNALAAIKQAEMVIDEKDAKKMAKGLDAKHRFNFNDLRLQFEQMSKMGGMVEMAQKMGLGKGIAQMAAQKQMDSQTPKFIGLIDSMTPKERNDPDIINGSRKMRIAKGAGGTMAEFNQLLKRYKMAQKMVKQTKSLAGQRKLMQRLGGLGGGLNDKGLPDFGPN